jgi:hypothetical protein
VCHDDGDGYEEGVEHEMQCSNCEKSFVFETYITFSYEAQKADCLNTGNHTFESIWTFPKEFTKMECTQCGCRRYPTKEEMEKILKED